MAPVYNFGFPSTCQAKATRANCFLRQSVRWLWSGVMVTNHNPNTSTGTCMNARWVEEVYVATTTTTVVVKRVVGVTSAAVALLGVPMWRKEPIPLEFPLPLLQILLPPAL